MSREREAVILRQLAEKPVLSGDAKLLLELMKLKLEKYKDELMKRESEQIRGRALELNDLIKEFRVNLLDTNITSG